MIRILRIDQEPCAVLDRRGEHDIVAVGVGAAGFLERFPEGHGVMQVQRPDGQIYPLISELVDGVVYAVLTATETCLAGELTFELSWEVGAGEQLAKSREYHGQILEAMGDPGEIPTDPPAWADHVLEVGGGILSALPDAIRAALAEAKESGEFDGEDGVSPTVEVSEITGGHSVTITDAEGPKTFEVKDGRNGHRGSKGDDGVSPTVEITEITGGHKITITDATSTQTADVMDGTDGQPGADGVSPTITVETITGGHKITITDAEGTQTVDVMDGQNGSDGRGISNTVLNTDYTLTITYTDGTTYTTPSIRGAKGDKGDPGEDAVVDDTLTQPGQAADAKVVGDILTSQSSEIATLQISKQDTATMAKAVRDNLVVNSQISAADKPTICQTIGAERGGKYELIETYTFTSNSSGFLRNAEPNGNPYKFSKVLLSFKFPERAGEMAVSVAINTDKILYTDTNALIRMTFNGTWRGVAFFKAFIENGLAFGELEVVSNVGDYSPNNANVQKSVKFLQTDEINSIALTSYQTDIIPQGSTVTIWAVRA